MADSSQLLVSEDKPSRSDRLLLEERGKRILRLQDEQIECLFRIPIRGTCIIDESRGVTRRKYASYPYSAMPEVFL